jgi:hypothetical protein
MSVSGTWVLHYTWDCTTNYAQTNITLNGDGTLSGPGKGQWRLRDGTLLISFETGPAKYGGTINGNAGSGAMSTFTGLHGCWYMLRQGITSLEEQDGQADYDALGNAL